jgi:hypothetical protein
MIKGKDFLIAIDLDRGIEVMLHGRHSLRLVKDNFTVIACELKNIWHSPLELLHAHGTASDDHLDGLLLFEAAASVHCLGLEQGVCDAPATSIQASSEAGLCDFQIRGDAA